jgi:hypothetical protein
MAGGVFSEGRTNFLQKDSTGRKFVVRIQGFAAEKCGQTSKSTTTNSNEKKFLES